MQILKNAVFDTSTKKQLNKKITNFPRRRCVSKINGSIAFTLSKPYHVLFSNIIIIEVDGGRGGGMPPPSG